MFNIFGIQEYPDLDNMQGGDIGDARPHNFVVFKRLSYLIFIIMLDSRSMGFTKPSR
jgi:hypothetical protein